MKILIGTTNQAKIKGAEEAFKNYYNDFEIEGIKVDSNVPDEPVDIDIYNGAKNRVDNLIKYAKNNRLDSISLEVRESNAAAISLYSSFGFKVEGKRKDFYTKPTESALVMVLRIK